MTDKFKLGGLLPNSVCNGKGIRCVLFFGGCSHNCKGCQNATLQSSTGCIDVTIDDIFDMIGNNMLFIDGITLSGGEPFEQPLHLLDELVSRFIQQGKTVWIYTGYKVEELINKFNSDADISHLSNIFKNIEMLVDGRFELDLLDNTDTPRGSTNQRLLDNESLKSILPR